MLTELSITNFKAWRKVEPMRLAPITVFFGSNSAGKTSILQLLLMLRQTAESPDRHRVLHPGDLNTPVELGTFRDLVYEHDVENEIEFGFSWTLPQPLLVRDPIKREDFEGDVLHFSATVSSDAKGAKQSVKRFRYSLRESQQDSKKLAVEMKAVEAVGSKYELLAEHYTLIRNPGRVWKLPPPIRFYAFPDEVGAHFQNAGFTSDLAL
jgi:predicted ATPase